MIPGQIRLLIITVATVAAASITSISSTPVPSKDSLAPISDNEMNDKDKEKLAIKRQKVIEACLTIAPNLLPCNFDVEPTWRSRSGEILHSDSLTGSGYPVGTMPEFQSVRTEEEKEEEEEEEEEKIFTDDIADKKDISLISLMMEEGTSVEKKNPQGIHQLYENDFAVTIVYYLEGCLPSRLPFDLPSCSIDELKTIRMNKVVPFKLPGYEVVEDVLIFPEIDVKQIEFPHRQSKTSPTPTPTKFSHRQELRLPRFTETTKISDTFSTNNVEDVEKMTEGIQDFNKMMLKSNTKPRTGIASKKYVSMLPGYPAGFTSISSSYSSSFSLSTEESSPIFSVDRKKKKKKNN